MARTGRVELRVTDAEKAAWAEAAGGSRRVSDWLRSLANREAFADKRAALPEGVDPPYEQHARSLEIPVAIHAGPLDEVKIDLTAPPDAPTTSAAVRVKPTAEQCKRWPHHRKGVYCGSCKKIN